ncbi:MAG TPA: PorV/PorQ family protein [Candidatus Limnocylindria bacterium]|nr:PorV/PorQ family protein [Candidatus Limnocylindria bacterium]
MPNLRHPLILPALVVLSSAALCLAPSGARAVTAGFAFLEVPAGARASALGGAYGTLADGVDAAFWNVAGLAGVQGLQVMGSHYEFFESLRHDQVAVAGRLFGGGLAASVRALYSEPIEERDESGNLIGTFGAHDLEFGLAYGRSLGGGLRVGGSAQLFRERVANLAASTYGFGGGASWEPPPLPRMRLGVSLHNWGADAEYLIDGVPGAPVPLPTAVQTGVSYGLDLGGQLGARAALETRLTRGRNAVGMLGAELSHPLGAAVRLGMRANDDASSLSVGAGYALSALRIDYAFVPYRLDLGDTHRLSFAAQF